MNRIRTWLCLQKLEHRTVPTTFTVTNLNDAGAGSLRQAVASANGTPGSDTIDFTHAAMGTITLTTGEIPISGPVMIDGPGASVLSISGNSASRVFNLTSAAKNTAIAINGLSMTKGLASNGGGAILGDDQDLKLSQCVLTANILTTSSLPGGAVYMDGGSLTATDCSFTENYGILGYGGAICATKTTLRRCTVSGNSSDGGGGIFVGNQGYLLLEDCTIEANYGGLSGGGVRVDGTFPPGALTIRNCTISSNSASTGAGIGLTNFNGLLVIQNSTITQNSITFGSNGGGGIARNSNGGTVRLESTIVAQNYVVGGVQDLSFNSATNIAGDNNIIGVANVGNFTLTGASNQTGTAATPLNAKLTNLGNFGGPTQTHHLLPGSPALDKGINPGGLSLDQRGQPRVLNGTPDIGAVEVNPLTIVVDITADENDGNYTAGDLSLREAMLLANASSATADTIMFSPTTFVIPRTITLALGEISVTGPVTVTGPGVSLLTLNGNNNRFFSALSSTATGPLTLANVTVIGCNGSAAGGGVIAALGLPVTVTNCAMTGNKGTNGAAIVVSGGGTLTATDCTFANNISTGSGGAVCVFAGPNATTALTRCTLTGNTATNSGGGVFAEGYLFVESCTISGNITTLGSANSGAGGGIRVNGAFGLGALSLRNSTLSGNSAKTDGGGIALSNFTGTLIVQNSTVTANKAESNGGGIARTSGTGTAQLDSAIVAQNSSTGLTPDLFFNAATNVGGNNNLIGAANNGNFNLTGLNNQTGTVAAPLNAKLGALAENGGATRTHLPLSGSPALDKGSNVFPLIVDQRGAPRSSGLPDVGAVELQPNATFVVDITADEGDSNYAKGDLSLREALDLASASFESTDSITFDSVAFGSPQTIALSLGEIAVGAATFITGPGASLLTISGKNVTRVFNLTSAPLDSQISLTGLRLSAGQVKGLGGAILMGDQELSLGDCKFDGNFATNGGALAVNGAGFLEAVNCQFVNNTAANIGGAITAFGSGATIDLRRSSVTGNKAFTAGGAYVSGAFLLENSIVSGNSAATSGGGLRLSNYYDPGVFSIRNSTISGNIATTDGGGIALSDVTATITVRNSTITANTANGKGGGIARLNGTGIIALESSIVAKNVIAAAPEIYTTGTVQAKNDSIFSTVGITTFVNLGGNRPIGEDPMLAPLADNGGPTQTHALLPGSPCINAGSNPANLSTDQRGAGFARVYGTAADIGAFEVQPPSHVQDVQINKGSLQRSQVTSLAISFDQAVNLPVNPAAAFALKRQSDGASVALNAAVLGNTVTLTFPSGPVDGESLADGRFTLSIVAAQVNGGNFDGNGDGKAGDDYLLVGSPANGLFRLFGDADGNGTVNGADFLAFRLAFLSSNSTFDFDGDGSVNGTDFLQFRLRFLQVI